MSNDDIFPENKAEKALKESQDAETESNDLAEQQVKELKSMSRLLEKLQQASVETSGLESNSSKGNLDLIKLVKKIEDKEAMSDANINLSFSDEGQVSLDMMKDIAKASLDADQQEQKILKEELKAIKDFVKSTVFNEDESKALFEINKSIEQGVKANSTLLAKFSDGVLGSITNNLMPALVGTVATVFADSPIIGVMAGLIGEGTKRAFEKRQKTLEERRSRARFRLEKLSAEHTKRLVELEEMKAMDQTDDEVLNEEEKLVQANINIDEMANAIADGFNVNFEELIDGIAEGLRAKFEEAGIDVSSIDIDSPNVDVDNTIQNENKSEPEINLENSFERQEAQADIQIEKEDQVEDLLNFANTTQRQLELIRSEIEKGNMFAKRGTEERRREAAIERDELISAIEGLKGSGIDGTEDEAAFEGLMDKLDFLGLGGIMTGIGVMFAKLAGGAKTLFKVAKKAFAPITAIVSTFRGFSDAMDEFEKSGSLLSSIGVGIQSTGSSIIEIFTFGLLDAEKAGEFLRDKIPTSISDSVFRAVDWVTELFDDPLGTLKSAGSGLVDMLSSAIMSPIYAITDFFGIDLKSSFANIKSFMSNMSETVYEWIASIVPDFIPDALVPDSILKYKDTSVAAKVATEDYNEIEQEFQNSNTITPAMVLELQKAREAMQLAQIQALRDDIYTDGDVTDESDERVQKLNTLKGEIRRTRETMVKTENRIEQFKDSSPKNMELDTITAANQANPIFAQKTDKTKLADRIEEKKIQIEQMRRDKENQKQGDTNIATNQNVVNNSSTTHISKEVFNSDPSIMRPLFN